MQSELVSALRARRPQICERWRALLHAEPVSSPLANPDALVHLIDWSFEEIFRALTTLTPRRRHVRGSAPEYKPDCPCGRNPLLAYFTAGEQAMQEGLILAQAAATSLDPIERDASLAELNVVLRHFARREIEAFCGVCQHRSNQVLHPETQAGMCTPLTMTHV